MTTLVLPMDLRNSSDPLEILRRRAGGGVVISTLLGLTMTRFVANGGGNFFFKRFQPRKARWRRSSPVVRATRLRGPPRQRRGSDVRERSPERARQPLPAWRPGG